MNELVNLLSSKVGLPADKAQHAVSIMLSYVKDKLPAPISGQVENILGQGATGQNPGQSPNKQQNPGDVASGIGNMFKK